MTPRKPARMKRKVAAVIKTRKEVVPDNSGQRQVRRRNTKSPRALKPKATGAGRDLWDDVQSRLADWNGGGPISGWLRAHFGKPREIYDVDDGNCWIIRKDRAR